MAHAAPCRICHLGILQMKAGLRKRAEIAGMIVMKMRDDDVANGGGINA